MVDPRRRPVGELLREWRERRRLSQLDLAIQADISTRHLSFVETGRSRPTPEMILRLTEQMEVPLRERNVLLLAGGYAPAYPQHGLDAPELDNVRAALRQVLAGHEPYPAVVIDRWWDLQDANSGIGSCSSRAAPRRCLSSLVNVLRLSLHPDGMAPRIANLGQWRAHLLTQLRHRARALGDAASSAVSLSYGRRQEATAHGAAGLLLRLRAAACIPISTCASPTPSVRRSPVRQPSTSLLAASTRPSSTTGSGGR